MRRGDSPGRIGAILLAGSIVVAPFIAVLFRAEAGLVVMAAALGATSTLLREALEAAPLRIRHWLRVLVAVNLGIAIVCVALAAWLVARS